MILDHFFAHAGITRYFPRGDSCSQQPCYHHVSEGVYGDVLIETGRFAHRRPSLRDMVKRVSGYVCSLDWRFWETYWTRLRRVAEIQSFDWSGENPIWESAGLMTRMHWRIGCLIRQQDWWFWETRESRELRIFQERQRFCHDGCWCGCQYETLETHAVEATFLTRLHWCTEDWLRLLFSREARYIYLIDRGWGCPYDCDDLRCTCWKEAWDTSSFLGFLNTRLSGLLYRLRTYTVRGEVE